MSLNGQETTRKANSAATKGLDVGDEQKKSEDEAKRRRKREKDEKAAPTANRSA
jgi:hypothetical protein